MSSQASHLRDLEKKQTKTPPHTCNFNQVNPVDVELKMRWISLLSLSRYLLSGCLLS